MAIVNLPVISATRTNGGAALGAGTAASAGSTYTFPNSGQQILRVKSTVADTALTATFVSGPDGTTPTTKPLLTPGTTTDTVIGTFPVNLYGTQIQLQGPVAATTLFWVVQVVPNQ
jgi:hypothetical protein